MWCFMKLLTRYAMNTAWEAKELQGLHGFRIIDISPLYFIPLVNTSIIRLSSLGGKGKAIPVKGREVPYGFETSRLPHFLDNRFTDGIEVVSLTCRPPFTRRKIPRTHFC
jgi:hypothetical protein